MRASDLAAPYPTVELDTPALAAARLMAEQNLPGLLVAGGPDRRWLVLPGTRLLRMAVPGYCQDDPALARVIDEAHADQFLDRLGDRSVRECLPDRPGEVPAVDPDATVLEVAAVMARTESPLVAVVDHGWMLCAITLDSLLDRMLGT